MRRSRCFLAQNHGSSESGLYLCLVSRADRARKLHCVEFAADPTKMWNLERLNNLRSIRFDFRGIVFDQTDIMDPDSGAALFAFSASAARIRHLDLRNLDWPAPWMLRHISLSFNGLESLYLEQDPIWCSLCNTCNLVQFKDPGPDFIVYTNGVGLPVRPLPPCLTSSTVPTSFNYRNTT